MAKVLYINAHPGVVEHSKSQICANFFLQEYSKQNPEDEITFLNLWKLDAPDVDHVVYSAFGALMSGTQFDNLTTDQQSALNKRQLVIDQFISHDKYIFVAPMWEFSFPAVLKKYLDIICVARQTFKYNELGLPVGLLKNKQAIFVQASGGNYTIEARNQLRHSIEQHQDSNELLPIFEAMGNLGEPILRASLAIMGISNYKHISVHSQSIPNLAQDALFLAQKQLKQLALNW